VNNTDPCSDASQCSTNDACLGGTCVGGPPANCNDNDTCTTDTCAHATGCANTPIAGCGDIVTLVALRATREGSGVRVRWETAAEIDCGQFEVLRCRASGGPCATGDHTALPDVAPVPCRGGPGGAAYEVLDRAAVAGAPWSYLLREHETTGRILHYGPVLLPAGSPEAAWDPETGRTTAVDAPADPAGPSDVAVPGGCASTRDIQTPGALALALVLALRARRRSRRLAALPLATLVVAAVLAAPRPATAADPPAFTIPATDPLFPDMPYVLSTEITSIQILVDPAYVAGILPAGVVPVPGFESLMLVTFADYDDLNTLGPYQEVVLGVFGLTPDPRALDGSGVTFGMYTTVLYLDSDGPIAAGREISGFPKKEAIVAIKKKHDGTTRFDVRRKGSTRPILGRPGHVPSILRASFTPLAAGDPSQGVFPPILNQKIIPNAESGFDVWQLTATFFGLDQHVTDMRVGEVTLDLIGGPDDPLDAIPVTAVLGGAQWHLTGTWTRGYPFGWIVRNYLAE
jgi:acetoacetate decarboxylase